MSAETHHLAALIQEVSVSNTVESLGKPLSKLMDLMNTCQKAAHLYAFLSLDLYQAHPLAATNPWLEPQVVHVILSYCIWKFGTENHYCVRICGHASSAQRFL